MTKLAENREIKKLTFPIGLHFEVNGGIDFWNTFFLEVTMTLKKSFLCYSRFKADQRIHANCKF